MPFAPKLSSPPTADELREYYEWMNRPGEMKSAPPPLPDGNAPSVSPILAPEEAKSVPPSLPEGQEQVGSSSTSSPEQRRSARPPLPVGFDSVDDMLRLASALKRIFPKLAADSDELGLDSDGKLLELADREDAPALPEEGSPSTTLTENTTEPQPHRPAERTMDGPKQGAAKTKQPSRLLWPCIVFACLFFLGPALYFMALLSEGQYSPQKVASDKWSDGVSGEKEFSGRKMRRTLAFNLGGGAKLEMVLIPAGEFVMGSRDSRDSDEDAGTDEKPQHRVQIRKPFYLGKYLVTQEQWEAVMGNNPSCFSAPKNPVEQVSWGDCQAFMEKLNARLAMEKGRFALPTEARWEYACRAGSTTRYCFGDSAEGLDEYAWYGKNSGGKTHPVGLKRANAWGLYDMHGNVWEWCQDWYDGNYYAMSPMEDPSGPATGSERVGRGGGLGGDAGFCRSAFRLRGGPVFRFNYLGFRVSMVPVEAD